MQLIYDTTTAAAGVSTSQPTNLVSKKECKWTLGVSFKFNVILKDSQSNCTSSSQSLDIVNLTPTCEDYQYVYQFQILLINLNKTDQSLLQGFHVVKSDTDQPIKSLNICYKNQGILKILQSRH